MNGPRVAVVTVNYDSADAIGAFLDSVPFDIAPLVIIADNGAPGDEALAGIAAAHGAKVQPMGANLGYGGAANAAVATLPDSVEYVLVANPDVVLHAGSLERLVRAADEHPEAGAVGPRIVQADGAVYPSARRLPSLRTGVGHALFGTFWPANPWTRSYRGDDDVVERVAGWLSGACLLVRRAAFDGIGGFDTGYFMYFEDVDLGARLSAAGWTNRYVPDAVVMHEGAHSTRRHGAEMERAHHRSAYRFVARKYGAWYLAPLRFALRVGIGVRERLTIRRRQLDARSSGDDVNSNR